MATIACVMPTFKAERVVEMGLRSILAQDFEDWELVVVDCGNDRTPEIVSRIVPQATILHFNKHVPLPRARDIGVVVTGARYIAFWDCDDYYPPCRLRVQLEACQAADMPSHVPYPMCCDPSLDDHLWRLTPRLPPTAINAGGTLLISREWWFKVGGYDHDDSRAVDGGLRLKTDKLGEFGMPAPSEFADAYVLMDHGQNTSGSGRIRGRHCERTDYLWRQALPSWAIRICDRWIQDTPT